MTYEDKIKSITQEVRSIFAYDGEVNPDLVIDIFCEKLLDSVELKTSYEKRILKAEPPKMRDANIEEIKNTNDYLKTISKPTGIYFEEE